MRTLQLQIVARVAAAVHHSADVASLPPKQGLCQGDDPGMR